MSFLKVTICIAAVDWMIWDFIPGSGKRFFAPHQCPHWLWSPPSLLFSGYCGCFPEHRVACAGSLPLTSILCQVKAEWCCTSAPPYTLMEWTGTTLPSSSSRCKFSFGGRAPTKYLNTASCVENLWIMIAGWSLCLMLKVVGCWAESWEVHEFAYPSVIMEHFVVTGCCWSHG